MKPIHPGAVLREDILKEMKISITHAAKELNVSRKQLSEIVNESAGISAEMAVRLENGFGVNAEFWLDMQKNFDIWKVKSSGRVQGVGFRYFVEQKANLLAINGFVKNLPDRKVYVEAEGDTEQLQLFISLCKSIETYTFFCFSLISIM